VCRENACMASSRRQGAASHLLKAPATRHPSTPRLTPHLSPLPASTPTAATPKQPPQARPPSMAAAWAASAWWRPSTPPCCSSSSWMRLCRRSSPCCATTSRRPSRPCWWVHHPCGVTQGPARSSHVCVLQIVWARACACACAACHFGSLCLNCGLNLLPCSKSAALSRTGPLHPHAPRRKRPRPRPQPPRHQQRRQRRRSGRGQRRRRGGGAGQGVGGDPGRPGRPAG
jgi:hypothetical protein